MSVKISIILPNYNGSKHICKAIDSFLSQTYPNKELVIVDGKSTDNSHALLAQYEKHNSNISWVKEPDRNVTDAINIGIRHCSGDFIAFLAADVFYFSNDIFELIDLYYAKLSFDMIYFDYYHMDPSIPTINLVKSPNVAFSKRNLLIHGTIAGFDNVFISRQIYAKYQYNPDFNLCSDWEFFLRMSQDKPLALYVEKPCTVNVQDGSNLSRKYAELQKDQIRAVAKLYNQEGEVLYFEKFWTTNTPKPSSRLTDLLRKIARRMLNS